MQWLNKYKRGFKHVLCIIDLFSKYAWIAPLKDKRGISIVNAFRKILDNTNRKPNKIWVDLGGEFYKNFLKGFLKINKIEIYSTYNEGKSVVTDGCFKILRQNC